MEKAKDEKELHERMKKLEKNMEDFCSYETDARVWIGALLAKILDITFASNNHEKCIEDIINNLDIAYESGKKEVERLKKCDKKKS